MGPFREKPPTGEDRARQDLDDLREIPDGTLVRLVVCRLFLASEVPRELHPTAQTFVPGLVVVIAVQLRMGRTIVPPEWVWEGRGGVDRWRAVALGNLSAVLDFPETEYRRVPFHGTAGLSTFMGQSRSVASLALIFDDLMRHLQVEDRGAGLLVSLPQDQQLFWRVIEGNETEDLIQKLITVTYTTCRDAGARRLSPVTYWVRGDVWQPLVRRVEDDIEPVLPYELLVALGID